MYSSHQLHRAAVGLLAVLIGCLANPNSIAYAEDFRIRARALEVLEGGPFIVEVTYTYQGRLPTKICIPAELPPTYATEEVPSHWKEHGRSFIGLGPAYCVKTLAPGQQWTEIMYLHHYYSNITPGRARIKLTWEVRTTDIKSKPIACPTAILELNVPPATSERLEALRRKLSKRITGGKMSEKDRKSLAKLLLGTQHAALEPVAWHLLETNQDPNLTYRLGSFIYGCTKDPEKVHARLVKMAIDPKRHDAAGIFALWRAHRIRLPRSERAQLIQSASLWTRMLAYVTYPEDCEAAWSHTLMRDLRRLGRPSIAPQDFEKLLRDLDDDSFVVREKASARFEQLGDLVQNQLRQALKMPLSLEAKRRIRLALEKIPTKSWSVDWTLDCKRALHCLALSMHNSEADAVLATLAEGDPQLRLTEYVKRVLKERQTPSSGR